MPAVVVVSNIAMHNPGTPGVDDRVQRALPWLAATVERGRRSSSRRLSGMQTKVRARHASTDAVDQDRQARGSTLRRAGIYARVSTSEQTIENQVPELTRMAEARGFTATVYSEIESGAKRRPVLENLIEDARRGRFETVFVWSLDRFGRGGALEALQTISAFEKVGVAVVSARESWLDTTVDNPFRDALISFTATVARMERTRLIERTRAGLERARAQGKRLGRPPCSPVLLGAAADQVAAGTSIRAAAKAVGVPERSVRRHLMRLNRHAESQGAAAHKPGK